MFTHDFELLSFTIHFHFHCCERNQFTQKRSFIDGINLHNSIKTSSLMSMMIIFMCEMWNSRRKVGNMQLRNCCSYHRAIEHGGNFLNSSGTCWKRPINLLELDFPHAHANCWAFSSAITNKWQNEKWFEIYFLVHFHSQFGNLPLTRLGNEMSN